VGRPVITTDMPGCRETVIDGVNGFLVPPRNPAAVAQAIEKFVNNRELIKKMVIESRKLAEMKFDVKEKNKIIIREIHCL
jgi:glycosyltransferase involved in cell wall biosynthesis